MTLYFYKFNYICKTLTKSLTNLANSHLLHIYYEMFANTKFVVDPQVSRIALRKLNDDGFEGTENIEFTIVS